MSGPTDPFMDSIEKERRLAEELQKRIDHFLREHHMTRAQVYGVLFHMMMFIWKDGQEEEQ